MTCHGTLLTNYQNQKHLHTILFNARWFHGGSTSKKHPTIKFQNSAPQNSATLLSLLPLGHHHPIRNHPWPTTLKCARQSGLGWVFFIVENIWNQLTCVSFHELEVCFKLLLQFGWEGCFQIEYYEVLIWVVVQFTDKHIASFFLSYMMFAKSVGESAGCIQHMDSFYAWHCNLIPSLRYLLPINWAVLS